MDFWVGLITKKNFPIVKEIRKNLENNGLFEFDFRGSSVIDNEINNEVNPPIYSQEELISYYSDIDIILHLSNYEGLPLTI